MRKIISVLFGFLLFIQLCFGQTCNNFRNVDRFDCHPENGATENRCRQRNCCWNPPSSESKENLDFDIPYCYYPSDFAYRYQLTQTTNTSTGFIHTLSKIQTIPNWPNDIKTIRLEVIYVSPTVLRIRVTNPSETRYEPPIPLNIGTFEQKDINYQVETISNPFYALKVYRTSSDGKEKLTVFDSTLPGGPLIFSDQFIQITTKVPSTHLYGFGEQRRTFTHDITNKWEQIAMYSRDIPPTPNVNLYGTHNFFVGLTDQGTAYGMFFLNSNPQEVLLQPSPSVTYRTIGGIIDLFIFTADSPQKVISDYYSLIGSPMLPPYWSLGFHLCRYGYKSTQDIKDVVERNFAAKMPQDVQWSDIDYMDKYYDWTVDGNNFAGFGDYVKKLKTDYNKKYVLILDPGIGNQRPGQYAPYDEGLKREVFITEYNSNTPLVGKVWPGWTVFPDFGNPRALPWWRDVCMKPFYDNQVQFDGLWIDMNEPSNFVEGSDKGCPNNNKYDLPPYIPGVVGGSLAQQTVCPSAKTYYGSMYDTHNLYGYLEANCTNSAIQQLFPKKRVFVLSRSTFAGSGRYTFHWTGDNQATWDNIYYSVSQVLNFNLFAIPMVGADICGFISNTNEELCTRWMQLGAYYPFMRNHNDIASKDQDPAVWSADAQNRMREALRVRYSLLPYIYTQMFAATVQQNPVFRPLWYDFPTNSDTHNIDSQFMLGPSLMVAPVLSSGINTLQVYHPSGAWCDLRQLTRFVTTSGTTNVPVDMNFIPVYIRGGSILPVQGLQWDLTSHSYIHFNPNATTTKEYRQQPLSLVVCFSESNNAEGKFVWDDGETTDSLENNIYDEYSMSANVDNKSFHLGSSKFNYKNADNLNLASIYFVGVKGANAAQVNGKNANYEYKDPVLRVDTGSLTISNNVDITWT
jgi:alpha-glucosidase (family GH31 glycosyl hydrolase)